MNNYYKGLITIFVPNLPLILVLPPIFTYLITNHTTYYHHYHQQQQFSCLCTNSNLITSPQLANAGTEMNELAFVQSVHSIRH